jgi:hypothetical protein
MAINFSQATKSWVTATAGGGVALTGALLAADLWGGWRVPPDAYLSPWVISGTIAAIPAFIEGTIQVGQNVGLWRRLGRARVNLAWAVAPALPVNGGREITHNGQKRRWFTNVAPGFRPVKQAAAEAGQWAVLTPYQRAPVFITDDHLAEWLGFVFTRQNNPATANDAASRNAWEKSGGKQGDYHALFGLGKRGGVVYPLGRSYVLTTWPARALERVRRAIPQDGKVVRV